MKLIENIIGNNGLVFAFLVVGVIMFVSQVMSRRLTAGRIPGVAIAITLGLVLAWFGGKKGIADYPLFAGMALLGGTMLRDFSIVSTAMGASLSEIRKAGPAGIFSLITGMIVAFVLGSVTAYAFGYTDAKSVTTIGAGALTFIVGPVTGTAIGASSDVVAISIATGVLKTVVVTTCTPLLAKRMGLDNPHTAMVFGGLIGTTSGVAAGLAATDPKLVPYGALTATFYTGLGCLLCPSVFYLLVQWIL
jgi:malonate transporter MadM subunit